MSILNKVARLNKAVSTPARVEMTDIQVEQCKEALRRDNRGYNVQPNRFDISLPYRVAINYQNEWYNFGNFKSADVAAAIGSIISIGFFGDKAVAGNFDQTIVENSEEFKAWMEDSRNQEIIARANGDKPAVHDGEPLERKPANTVNPF